MNRHATICDGAAARLELLAAPAFAALAMLASVGSGGSGDALCAPVHGPALLGGMAPMYLLMSASHLPPWLRLFGRERIGRTGAGVLAPVRRR